MLTEEQLWKLYAIAKRCQWEGFSAAASAELGVEVSPSRSGYFRWLDFMRGQESERRLAQARIAALEADELAKSIGLKDGTAIAAYKSLAAEFALKSDAKTANRFMQLAMALRDRELHAADIDLKERSQKTKDAQLKLAREKFEAAEKRLNAVQGAVDAPQLTDAERVAKIKSIFGMKQ
jgi:hypothetical protein